MDLALLPSGTPHGILFKENTVPMEHWKSTSKDEDPPYSKKLSNSIIKELLKTVHLKRPHPNTLHYVAECASGGCTAAHYVNYLLCLTALCRKIRATRKVRNTREAEVEARRENTKAEGKLFYDLFFH